MAGERCDGRPGKATPGRRRAPAVVLLGVLGAATSAWAGGCGGGATAVPASRRFAGTWNYSGGINGSCKETSNGQYAVLMARIEVRPLDDGFLEAEISCRCRIKLGVNDSPAPRAALSGPPATCQLYAGGSIVTATLNAFEMTLDGGDVRLKLDGSATLDTQKPPELDPLVPTVKQCPTFSSSDFLVPGDEPGVGCGQDETAVGVLPVSTADGTTDCPTGSGRDGVQIYLDDENYEDLPKPPRPPFCHHATGRRGEGPWVLPDAAKYRPACTDPQLPDTVLYLCRVDGALFKPTSRDPAAAAEPYAVLQLGSRCPPGAVSVTKRISEESPGKSNIGYHVGDIGPNVIHSNDSNTAVLQFCYFAAAGRSEPTMTEFPELGFPYAVFHDFEGPQPSWVIAKRWDYSDNEDEGNTNTYLNDTGNFKDIIEDINHDTTFDLARVR